MAIKIKVRCILEVVVELPEGETIESMQYRIEENGCPGTGIVGAAIDNAYEHGKENSVCWACNLSGRNEIIGEIK